MFDLKRPQEALASLDEAIVQDPGFAIAHNNRGKALLDLNCPEEALASFDKAVSLQPDFPNAWNNRASALVVLCRWNAVEEACRHAISLKPDFADAWMNLCFTLNELDRWEEAVAACRNAVNLAPDEANAWNSLSYALVALCRWGEGEAASPKALALKPNYREAWINLSRALMAQDCREEGLQASRRAHTLTPKIADQSDFVQVNGRALHEAINELIAQARAKGTAFALDAEQIRALHRIAMRNLLHQPGEYRKTSIAIIERPDLPPSWRDVRALMEDMCRYINASWAVRESIHLAEFVLWRLPWIHPFDDGNGMIARALCNAILCINAASSLPITELFMEAIVEKGTAGYIGYITSLMRADAAYLETHNFDQAVRHVQRWLEPLAREHLKA